MVNGAKLAAKELNAKGGINGKEVVIVPIDDKADPTAGVTAANAAIEQGLDGVVGPYNSGVGVKTLPLYIDAGLVPIRLTSNSSTNSLGYTLQPMDYQIAPVASEGLVKFLKAKKVAIIYDSTALYTQQIAKSLRKSLTSAGATTTAYIAISPGKSGYTTQVAAAAATKPDVIYAATYFPEGGLIAKAIKASGTSAKCVADYGSDDPGFITTAGLEAAKNCEVVGVPAPSDFPKGPDFVAAYKKEFSTEPGTWSPYTYDSLNLLAKAATDAKGFDKKALTDSLNQVKDWQGVTGLVTIDPDTGNRDPATVVYLTVDDKSEFHVNQEWATAVGADY
jgi:branched-chain amino acid transport system substrate-binding protein